ncbi:hypothetical protein [Microbacterium invictum]|uniref:Uncharacterized protein n=1 Tax=Microbacterium invictum TaxID=515415 RepID=A0AA40SQI7_9MICO|nr:hypothetical protein [Microbacterium invictum]MBB4140400.1 hypothetical protein [Microbacterium invictum]
MSKTAAAAVLAEFIAERVRRLDLDDRELLDFDIEDAVHEARASGRRRVRRAADVGPSPRSIRIAYRRRAGII